MEIDRPVDASLLSRVSKRLESDDARQLFSAVVEAQRRAGAKGVKELMSSALAEARGLRLDDAEAIHD